MPVHLKANIIALFSLLILNCESNRESDHRKLESDVTPDSQDSDKGKVEACLYKTNLLESLETASENMAFSGGDLLSLFEGEQLHRAIYATENDTVEQTPLGGDTILLLKVAYDDGEVRDVVGNAPECGDYLEIDVTVSARTSDTAFAEEVDGVIYFYKNEVEEEFEARLYADLKLDALSGRFEINRYVRPPNPEEVIVFLDQQIDVEGTLLGSVVVMTKGGDDDADEAFYQEALSWQTALVLQ